MTRETKLGLVVAASFLAPSRGIIQRRLENPFVDSLFEKR